MNRKRTWRVLLGTALFLAGTAVIQKQGDTFNLIPSATTAAAPQQAPTACVGTPMAGNPVDVTSLMSVPPAPGVTIQMDTGWNGSAPTNTPNYLTNSDVIIHSPMLNVLIFNTNNKGIKGAYSAADAWDQQVAAQKGGLHVRPAPDGQGFVQPGGNKQTDPQWTDLSAPGNCQTVTLANKGYTNLASNNGIPTSLPVKDPSHNNVHLITWAPDGLFHRVYTDGTFVCDGGSSCPGISPPDGFQPSQGFHRLRENYAFPHWMHYTRTGDSVQRLWLYNFDTNQTCYLPHGNHDHNSSDGTMYAVQDPGQAQFYIFKVFDSKGKLLSNVGCSGAGPLTINGIAQSHTVCTAGSPGWCANLGNLPNQLAGSPKMNADFCVFSFDNTFLFCTAGQAAFPGHQQNEHVLYMVVPNTGLATIPTSSSVAYLTPTDGSQTQAYEGIPVPNAGYLDANGVVHTFFRSDKMWQDLARTIPFIYNSKGSPEIFEVTFSK